MLHKNYFKYFLLENGKIVSLGHMWDGNLVNAHELLGDNVKLAIPLYVTSIHYKRTKKDKPFRVIYCEGLDGESSFADFNNRDILKNHAYIFVGIFKKGWFNITKFHKLKMIIDDKKQDNRYNDFGRIYSFNEENTNK